MKGAESIYTPSEWGQTFHLLPHNEALGAGSAGPGKSLVLLWDPLAQIEVEHRRCVDRSHPHYHPFGMSTGWALHLRRTTPMLETSIQRSHKMFPVVDPGAKWDANKMTWTFSSGYRYQFGHCSELNDWDRYLSSEYTYIGYDELVQFTEEQYEQINTRLRSTDPVLSQMLKIRAMSNPVMRRGVKETFAIHDPYWVRKRFVDPDPNGRVTLKKKIVRSDGEIVWRTRIYLPAKLSDNPNAQFVRDYEVELLDKPPHIRHALLDGDWYITADSYYGALWRRHIHVCDPFRIPDEWPVFRSMDWGFKKPGCVHWWAIPDEGPIYVFKEYTFQDKTADIVAQEIKAIEKDLGLWGKNNKSRITGPADTQIWEERGNKAKSMAQEFAEVGVQWAKADKKSRQRNAERFSRLLDHGVGTRDPGIVFFRGCINAIRTIPGIQMSTKNVEEPEDGGDDHWHDSVLYGCAYVSHGRSFVGSRYDDDEDDEEQPRAARGRFGYGDRV